MPSDRLSDCNFSLISFSDFLPKLRYLEHPSLLGLQRELADRGDVRVVQAIGGADAELDFVDTHVQQFLELGLLVVLLVGGFFKFHRVLVVADKYIEVMRQNRRGLGQRVVRRNPPVRPDFQDQAVIIRAVADARGFHRITHPGHRREQRVNRHNANRLAGLLVFIAGAETAANFDREFHLKFFLLVQRANVLGGVDQFNVLVQLNIGGGNHTFLVNGKQQGLLIARVRFELHLFQVQHNVGDVFGDAFDGGKLMHGTVHLQRGDGRALEGGQQHTAKRVTNGVAVTGFKRVGNKFRVGFSGRSFILLQPLGHFKTSETNWHNFLSTILIWLPRLFLFPAGKTRVIVFLVAV